MNKVRGFTLIELLIALFIFVLTMTIAVYGVIQLTKHSDSYHKKQIKLIELQSALILFQFDLMQTIQRYKLNNQNQVEPVFWGNKNEIWFNKIGGYNEKVHYYLNDKKIYRNNQIILEDSSTLEFRFVDKEGKSYEIWPPIQEWAYLRPNGIKISINSHDFGQFEKWAKISDD